MNNYAILADVKDDRRIQGTKTDAALTRINGAVSRSIDNYTNRRYYSEHGTWYVDGPFASDGLWLPFDVLSIESLTVDGDADGIFETTLLPDVDYWLYPDNTTPKFRIDIVPTSATLSSYPLGPTLSRLPIGRKAVKLTGVRGYSNDTELTGATLSDEGVGVDATETSITLATGGGALVSLGETIVVESEQMYVGGVAGDVLSPITRAINGTTAAVHANGTPVYRRRYPEPIERAASMQMTRMLREQQLGTSESFTAAAGVNAGFGYSALYPMIRDMLAPYVLKVLL